VIIRLLDKHPEYLALMLPATDSSSSDHKRRKRLRSSGFLPGLFNRKPSISTPYDPVHLTHVGYDRLGGAYKGLPDEWQSLLPPECECSHIRLRQAL
jgi:hypothetical protein